MCRQVSFYYTFYYTTDYPIFKSLPSVMVGEVSEDAFSLKCTSPAVIGTTKYTVEWYAGDELLQSIAETRIDDKLDTMETMLDRDDFGNRTYIPQVPSAK